MDEEEAKPDDPPEVTEEEEQLRNILDPKGTQDDDGVQLDDGTEWKRHPQFDYDWKNHPWTNDPSEDDKIAYHRKEHGDRFYVKHSFHNVDDYFKHLESIK